MKAGVVLALSSALLLPAGSVGAQKYPERPIRLIIASAPGGTVDIIGRLIAQRLTPALGQTVVPDNRAGASGTLAAEITAKAAPDGYTILLVSSPPMASNVTLRAGKMTYDPRKDFTPITLTGKVPLALAVLPSFPAKTFKELVAYAKTRPGKINYGSAGTASTNHLVGELLKAEAGFDMTHVPFKGGAPAMTALLAREIDMYIATLPTIMPMVQAGRIRAIAVSSSKRSVALPDVPTVAESGVPGFDLTSWYCIVAPAGLPAPILARLNAEIVKILNSPDSRDVLVAAGVNVEPMTPGQLGAFVRSEIDHLARAVKIAGLKVE
jgi:tripartite-type tricarboxylate transporter receptor subunit TctC